MKIILLRHATRDLGGVADCSLNRTGQTMAQRLIEKQAPGGALPRATHLLSSPKKRARETLLPLSRALSIELQILEALNERQDDESPVRFKKRVQDFLMELPKNYAPTDVIYICSHADWLEDAMVTLPSDASDLEMRSGFACAETRIFESVSGGAEGVWHFCAGGRP